MEIKFELASLAEIKGDAAAVFIVQEKNGIAQQIAALGKQVGEKIQPAVALKDFSGKAGELLSLYTERSLTAPRLFLVGMGEPEKLSLEKIRRGSAAAATAAQKMKLGSLAIEFSLSLPDGNSKISPSEIAQAIVEGAALSAYKYDKYITSKDNGKKLNRLTIFTPDKKRGNEIRDGVRRGEILVAAACAARDLQNAPSNEIYPETLAHQAQQKGNEHGFKVTVFDQRKIESLNMGGVLTVGKGSNHPPRFIILEHNPGKVKTGTVVLVGKGVTFDSGGISIKPAANMAEMKMDMSGAAAVIGTFQALAELQLQVHVIGLIPAVENMPSGTSMKPGDIVRHYGGKTSEVDNTDAEGRLILADALGYASQYKPDVVIDLATLTGACVVALGHLATGMMGNDQPTMDALKIAGETTYERVWQLPLFDEFEKLIKSDVADVKNVGGRWGGAITAGWFLKKFVGEYKWVHLDIAGTAILEESMEYIPKGGSGVGVRLLVEFLKNRK